MVLPRHPSARVRSLSSVYNCMGMVFASRRTWIDPEHLYMILEDDDYRRVLHEGELVRGDLVIYRDEEGHVTHVGLVAEVRTNLREARWEVIVLSQWGEVGEYFHHIDDVEPNLGKPTEYWTDRI